MAVAIHHSVVVTRDLDQSLRFYRDGLGLTVLRDMHVDGNWPELFDAPGRGLRAVFLGDPDRPDDHAGVLELNQFDDPVAPSPADDSAADDGPAAGGPPGPGFFLLSFFADVEATLARLAALGLGGPPRRTTQPTPRGPVDLAAVRDPDGVLIMLTPGSITRPA
jgi:catechol 2,3-dioxygenase-like lactoylglutathione lyase family enzyme